MFGNDHYPIHLGINENVPFRVYKKDGSNGRSFHTVNVVAINKDIERATCIVVEKEGKFADFYYNGSEENFKMLTEPGYEEHSWEEEDFGVTPDVILKNGVSQELIYELIKIE